MQIVIPAAGSGKRLQDINPNRYPKSLIEINGEKIIDLQLKGLKEIDVKEYLFITGAEHEKLEQYIQSKNLKNIKFIHNKDYNITNCGYSLSLALPHIKDDWIYLNSDLILEKAIFKLINKYIGSNSVCVNYGQRTDLHTFLLDKNNYIKKWMPIDTYITTEEEIKKMPTPDGEIVGPIIGTKDLSIKLLSKFNNYDIVNKREISCYTLFSKILETKYLTIDITNYAWKEIDTKEDFYYAEKILSRF